MNKQRVLIRALSLIPKLGPVSINRIIKLYPQLEQLWHDSNENIYLKLGNNIANKLIPAIYNIDPEKLEEEINKTDIKYITIIDKEYPLLLKQIYDPPVVIYYKGNINILKYKYKLAVVGSRKLSNYGKEIIPYLLKPLTNNIVIVSGLAIGADSAAHQIAVDNNKATIAVLGGGLDYKSFYPKQNTQLAKDIINNNGLIISEYPPGKSPKAQNFPRRNRIISGLCQACLVIEAADRSGSLITAWQALDQNREVLTVPGHILLTNSLGTNKLLQRGALPIIHSRDIFNVYKHW
ncbi:MAG: DNA-processing protein DprA [Candidatus Komeilibacteria bacterium]